MIILSNKEASSELDYQALDYCRIFHANLDNSVKDSQSIKTYLGYDFKTVDLSSVSDDTILVFRTITPSEIKQISKTNKIIVFCDGPITANVLLIGSAVDSFVAFGSRSAYNISNGLRNAGIEKPVKKMLPWVSLDGIKTYEKIPLGKLTNLNDIGLRPMFRMMAAGAVVIVPNISPFNEVIVDGYNGIIYWKDINNLKQDDYLGIAKTVGSQATLISTRAKEMTSLLMNQDRYRLTFEYVISSGYDHNEPWTSIGMKPGPKLIIPKQIMKEGGVSQLPESIDSQYKILKPSGLRSLLEFLIDIKFTSVHVFDANIETIDEMEARQLVGLINKLSKKFKNVTFCMEKPKEWSAINNSLIFMAPSEAIKQL